MSAKNGTCTRGDKRRAVGTFGGKALCNHCRPLTDKQRDRRAARETRRAEELAKVEELRKLTEARAEQHRLAEAAEEVGS